ncbi:MAG: SpoIID/LytB domain-containing protein [candidate division Zixibacteria bacterium]|nr:SpoIID/LytB domain-containing protein [candidate division Zixibacteria bacterium]
MEKIKRINFRRVIKPALRLVVSLSVILIVWGCGVVPQLHEGSEANYIRLPFVRVLLTNDSPELTISSNGSFTIECLRGNESSVYYSSQPVTILQEDGFLSVTMAGEKIDDRFEEIIVTPRSDKGFLSYRNQRYRGMFRIITHGRNLSLINIAHIDDYLKGVVPPEMGKVEEVDFEAIKAQAVAARTYSLGHLSQYPDELYDMHADVTDQLYSGADVENPLVSDAIEQTRGYVIKFEDKLINAYYHSTCGGSTDDIEEIWDKPSAPYLRATSDDGACSWSKYYRWREAYTAEQLKLRVEEYLSAERGREIRLDDLVDIEITARTAGERVAELMVKTEGRSYTFGRDKIRWIFKRSSNPELILQSAKFDVITQHDQTGRLTRVEFEGGGYGHGIGMCQCGAIGMAKNGKKFDEILTHYYRNTRLVKLY